MTKDHKSSEESRRANESENSIDLKSVLKVAFTGCI
jgi:hypothetical protein